MVYPTFLSFSLNFSIIHDLSHSSGSSLVFADYYRVSPSLAALNIISPIFGIEHLVMSLCRVFSCVVGRWCLLWPVHSLGRTLLAFALLHFVLHGQTCLLLHVFSTSYFCIPVPYDEKDIFFGVFVLEGLVGLHRTIWLQLLQHYWSVHRLDLPWYWMVCLGNEQGSFYCFWDCTQVWHFELLLTMRATPFLLKDSCPQ